MNHYMKNYFRTISDNVTKLNGNDWTKKEGEKRKGLSTDSKFSKEDFEESLILIHEFMKDFERKSNPAVRIQ